METYLIDERPSALPAAAAALRVRPSFAGFVPAACPDIAVVNPDHDATWLGSPVVPRHSVGFGVDNAAETARRSSELLADVKTVIRGTSVSAPISGYAAQVQQMANKQVNVGTAGVGGDPPRGRPI